MTEFEPTTAQQRMDLLTEVNEFLRDTLMEWARSWNAGPIEAPGEALRLRWQDDGTAVLEMEYRPVMRLTVGIETTIVEHVTAGPRTDLARPMTWGTVPAGWYVQAPTGWFRVISTVLRGMTQSVALELGNGAHSEWPRNPHGAVTACPGPPNATDDATEVLHAAGFTTEILEDGS